MNVTNGIYYECGNCKQQYYDLAIAEDCCKPRACECGRTIEKRHHSLCNVCIEHNAQFSWECAERADSTYYLYSDLLEKFINFDDVTEEILYNLPDLDEDDEEYQEIINASAPELARRYRIYLTKPSPPRHGLNLHEYFDYDEYEDGREMVLPDGWKEAENAVNDWLRSVPLEKWPIQPSNIAWSGQ